MNVPDGKPVQAEQATISYLALNNVHRFRELGTIFDALKLTDSQLVLDGLHLNWVDISTVVPRRARLIPLKLLRPFLPKIADKRTEINRMDDRLAFDRWIRL